MTTRKQGTNITLIGMPGTGKSTAGVILAKVAGMEFLDSDLLIQKQQGKKLSEIIEEVGVDQFLQIENDVLSSIEAEHTVIATGGSAVYGRNAMYHLRDLGQVVYLRTSYRILEKRLRNLRQRGVVLKRGQTLRMLYEERAPLYAKYADVIIHQDEMDVEDTVAAIVRACGL